MLLPEHISNADVDVDAQNGGKVTTTSHVATASYDFSRIALRHRKNSFDRSFFNYAVPYKKVCARPILSRRHVLSFESDNLGKGHSDT